jgi:hypothetical protein
MVDTYGRVNAGLDATFRVEDSPDSEEAFAH